MIKQRRKDSSESDLVEQDYEEVVFGGVEIDKKAEKLVGLLKVLLP